MSLEHVKDVLLRSRRLLIITGAGISTDSGIPDYRSPGRPPHRPIQHGEFLGNTNIRKRYWARSMIGYEKIDRAEPNINHRLVASFETRTRTFAAPLSPVLLASRHCTAATAVHATTQRWPYVITQNVDGLHARAGSQNVFELHGSMQRVICLECQTLFNRREHQQRLEEANPDLLHYMQQKATLALQSSVSSSPGSIPNVSPYLEEKRVELDSKVHSAARFSTSHIVPPPRPAPATTPSHQYAHQQVRPDGDIELEYNTDTFHLPRCLRCDSEMLKPQVTFFGYALLLLSPCGCVGCNQLRLLSLSSHAHVFVFLSFLRILISHASLFVFFLFVSRLIYSAITCQKTRPCLQKPYRWNATASWCWARPWRCGPAFLWYAMRVNAALLCQYYV